MSNLSLEEFNKLSEKEKGERYKDLSEENKFLVRISMSISGKVIGNRKQTKEDKKRAKEFEEAVKLGKITEWFNKK